ncbi:response regulator [Telmatospirillum siberiense]|uniref:Response regulator n=1 Tax=Telmatospirillum siberiense TaxID=382514 RepID=A0A2N3PZL4_9PROT|nr:response regulator [Telmatospirillum siberiense]PKU25801.1 response regulator [Telmatospirillum siberiense]
MSETIRIIFVDDEPHVLNGLRRAMSGAPHDWEMTFCASGEEAVALMTEHPADVIVSDMRMPEMDGAQLLEIVRQRHPETVRIILSGYADASSVLRTVGPAHAYLAKPCDSQTLAAAIARPLTLRRIMTSEGLHKALGGITNLPSLPEPYVKIAEELRSPNSSIRAVADIVAQDIAMTAELLKLTNSAFFSVGARITTPLQAVRTLGLETVQALVLRIGIFRQFGAADPRTNSMMASLNSHSLRLARLCEAIAETEGADPPTAKMAYCAGMLSCLGMLILLDAHTEPYRALMAKTGPETPLEDLEQEAFGASHTLMGAYLLGLWGFSETVVEAIALSGRPKTSGDRENPLLTALHAARALGPPLPWLAPGVRDVAKPDADYLQSCRKLDRIAIWQELSTRTNGEAK